MLIYTLVYRHLAMMMVLTISLSWLPVISPSMVQLPIVAPATLTSPTVDVLPGGCIGVTPPGDPEPPCCVSGLVFIDGQAVAGAEVEVRNSSGAQVTMITQVFSATTLPHYRLNLAAAPLNVQIGESITVTARYSGHERSIAHMVRAGGQQVDVVLAMQTEQDYMVERQIWHQAEPSFFNRPKGIDVSDSGNIYVVDTNNARIQVFDQNGLFIRQWGTLGTRTNEFTYPKDIAIDNDGNVYVTDSSRVQKFSSTGTWLQSLGTKGSSNGQFSLAQGITVDSLGNVYVADNGNNRIQKFSPTGVWLQSLGTVGSGNGQFNLAWDVSVDSNGNIFVVDRLNYRIQKFNSSGTWLQSWGTKGSGNGQFDPPSQIDIDQNNNIYISEGINGRVQKFTNDGIWLSSWNSLAKTNGELSILDGIALDLQGNIYIVDWYKHRVEKMNASGAWLQTIGSKGASTGQMDTPIGLAVDASGNIYVADRENSRIQKFNQLGVWLATWGSWGTANGEMKYPEDIALDADGNILVAEWGNHRVQKFTAAGIWLSTWGIRGTNDGQLSYPDDIDMDDQGNIYVSDAFDDRIQKFTNTGTWLQTWYSGADEDSDNHGIDVDHTGNIYATDRSTHQVFKFNNTGTLLGTISSAGGRQLNGQVVTTDSANNMYTADSLIHKFAADGTWLASWGKSGSGLGEFGSAQGLVVDQNNKIYVSDFHNRIQIFRPMTFTRPTATITHLSAASLEQGDTLVAAGMGQDSDHTPALAAYEWRSDRDGVLGSATTLSRSAGSLTPGTHRISLRVRDGDGEWSDSVAASIYVAPAAQRAWTMLLYLAGDFHDGGSQLNTFNRALAELGDHLHNPALRIAVQIDGRANGDTRRLLISPGSGSSPPTVTEIPFGEQAMDHPDTLRDFIIWGQTTFPASHYYLSIADHGQAIQGIAWDTTSDLADDGVVNDSAYLTPAELGQALTAPNVAPLAIVHLDACSMNLLEIAYEVRQSTAILIASQYLGWGYFAYDDYANQFTQNDTAQLIAVRITQRYAARARADRYPFTIAALDLARAAPTLSAVDDLAAELAALIDNGQLSQATLHGIWQDSQRFESNGDYQINDLDMYVDLADWASKIHLRISSPAVKSRVATLVNALTGPQPFIVAGSNQSASAPLPSYYANGTYINLANANGISIFYPGTRDSVVYDAYINDRLFQFTSDSRWRNFLIAGFGPTPPPLPGAGPGPLPILTPAQRVFIPMIVR